jgi:hypothetical protein
VLAVSGAVFRAEVVLLRGSRRGLNIREPVIVEPAFVEPPIGDQPGLGCW